ncbi:MAG: antitoxin [Actinomycetota bacterium]
MRMTLTRRLHVLLDEQRCQRLARRAGQRKTSVATLVREAIDTAFPPEDPRKAAAAREILEARPMPVPSPAQLKRELGQIRARR